MNSAPSKASTALPESTARPAAASDLPSDIASRREQFGRRLSALARHWRRAIDHELASLNLTDATWRPLIHLHLVDHPIRQKDLAARLGLDGSSVVRLLDILCADGLVERTDDAADRRAKLLSLTDAGHALARRVHVRIQAFEHDLLRDIDDSDIARFSKVFDQLEAELEPERNKGAA
ncbi:transcriptional regulator [Pigmentiphaga litoralis]|uniref:MarR family winged helix-turn-helix transcriptional regulator n=1 Tax=Pigmentiphaga litoralis TaxID=516702 RepID=UPI001674FDB4|nr:MarR family transcriptional regulator [Pigmentiphaga litoralis]GGX29689.1 transcriptional regulator [Pigmentiphaga litoralis]